MARTSRAMIKRTRIVSTSTQLDVQQPQGEVLLPTSRIIQACQEYENLQTRLQSEPFEDTEPLLDRQSQLVVMLIETTSGTRDETAAKAKVLLDWLHVDDIAGHLAMSLCRDVIRLLD